MAAPTSVRVESNSVGSAILHWVYAGTENLVVYRALHGGAYSDVSSPVVLPSTTTTYTDESVATGVFYDYKVSDDGGATFSAVVSVVIQVCDPPSGSNQSTSGLGLPQFVSEEDVNAANLQQISQQIEATLGIRLLQPQRCIACPVNGALVIDCSDSCFNFVAVATEDINSVSILGCNTGKIEIIVPPNTTREICGFPAGFGFTGDECFYAPVVAGPDGRTVSLFMASGVGTSAGSRNGYSILGSTSGRGGGGGGCTCTPTGIGELTIKSCNDNNSLNCSSNKLNNLIACGGRPPYSWSASGGLLLSRTTGTTNTVRPPANTGSAVAGVAYKLYNKFTASAGGFCENWIANREFSCADVAGSCASAADPGDLPATCNNGNIASINVLSCKSCSDTTNPCIGAGQCNGPNGFGCNATPCADMIPGGKLCDKRTAPMIAAGCVPCGLSIGATVTVTDSLGVSATIIMTA